MENVEERTSACSNFEDTFVQGSEGFLLLHRAFLRFINYQKPTNALICPVLF
jgi:hypothetical protein